MITASALRSFPGKQFDLLNVAFEHKGTQGAPCYDSPDRQTAIDAFEELKLTYPNSQIRLICIDIPYKELEEAREAKHISKLVFPMNTVLDDSIGFAVWFAARGIGYDLETGVPTNTEARVRQD